MKRYLALFVTIFMLTGCSTDGEADSKATIKVSLPDAQTTSTSAVTSVEIDTSGTTNETKQTEPLIDHEEILTFIKSEKVNGICIGMPVDEVKALLGEPDKMDEEESESGDGILQCYYYDKLEPPAENNQEYGTVIIFERIDGLQYVRNFDFFINATTASGVKIGSTRSEVVDAYKDNELEPLWDYVPVNEWETTTIYDKYPLMIGHWKTGGIIFMFDDNDNVNHIRVTSGTII